MKVLIIDDIALVRRQLRNLVDEFGFESSELVDNKNEENIIRAVAEQKPDVVLLDLNLFGKSSLDMIPRILNAQSTSIVMCTGVRDEEAVRASISNGAVGYLLKPINSSRLKHTLFKIKAEKGIY